MNVDIIHNEDCRVGLRKLPSDCIDCCITSPPYFGLRDYGTDAQIGLESSPKEYVRHLKGVFRQVLRVLKPSGTLWLVIGDCYSGSPKGAAINPDNAKKWKQGTNRGTMAVRTHYKQSTGIPTRNLIGIPWMVAFALRDLGFYLRQDIIWSKPNAMPESVKTRCVKSHEYIFLLSKEPVYYFDYEAIQTASKKPNGGVKWRVPIERGANSDLIRPLTREWVSQQAKEPTAATYGRYLHAQQEATTSPPSRPP